jgi:hypothetical protein
VARSYIFNPFIGSLDLIELGEPDLAATCAAADAVEDLVYVTGAGAGGRVGHGWK